MVARDEMIEGYGDGLRDTRDVPPAQSNRSEAYWHGWKNGRDDRLGQPRALASELRKQAAMLAAAQE